MSAGVGLYGRDLALTMGGKTVAGVRSKGITVNNSPIDVSDDDSNAFRELLAEPGDKSIDISLSGVTKSMELMRAALTPGSQLFALVLTWPDGSSVTLDGFLASYSSTGEYNGAETFDASFNSSGDSTFTPGS